MNVAIIGYGYWGEKVYNTLCLIIPKKNIFVVDRASKKTPKYINRKTLNNVLKDKNITHVLIVTPEETHFKIAKQCLENNKNIFVEKPLCLKKVEAKSLHQIAKNNNLEIYVDYIFLFDSYVKKIKNIIGRGILGTLRHIESTRHSININKPKVSVFDDLATHDIYLGKYFFNEKITKAKAINESILSKQINQASIVYYFNNKTLSANYSWIQPTPKRTMVFIGDRASLVWDKNEDDLLLFVNQKLVKKVEVKIGKSPLELSIKKFISDKNTHNYVNDVEILEKYCHN